MAYTLIGADGAPYTSATPGALGGHRRNRGYGRLDCPTALRWIARGHYVRHRVFFADEPAAIAAGYRPCASCLPERYAAWRSGAEWPDAAVAAAWRTLRVAGPVDTAQLLHYLAARAIPGVERVEDGVFRRSLALPHGPAMVELDLRRNGRVRFRLAAGDARDRRTAIERCRRLLGLDVDTAEARRALARDPVLGPLVAARPGLRVPGALDGAELAVRAIVNQQVSLAGARTVLGRLVDAYGRPTPFGRDRLFPSAERLAAVEPTELPMPRARGRALVTVCRAAASGDLDLRPGADPEEARAKLLALPGVGDWTASYVAMRALRDADAFPAGDLAIRRVLARLGPDPERWRPWRAYAAQHLWASVSDGPR
ncbi:MAG: AraC family transcriptional regulator [Thermoleophilaceae bacterium]|nr:AraC family transcriptional regulator [Thermoleophilaceae bacterium]